MTRESRPYSVALALVLHYAEVRNALRMSYAVTSMDVSETQHVCWRLGTIYGPNLAL